MLGSTTFRSEQSQLTTEENVIKQIEQSFAVESGVKPVFEAEGAAADGEFL